MRIDKILQGLCMLLLATTLCAPVATQTWPSRPIRALAPYPPGGPSGNIGTSEAARANPDGHTWLLATDGVEATNSHMYRKLGFSVEDLMPVMVVTNFSHRSGVSYTCEAFDDQSNQRRDGSIVRGTRGAVRVKSWPLANY